MCIGYIDIVHAHTSVSQFAFENTELQNTIQQLLDTFACVPHFAYGPNVRGESHMYTLTSKMMVMCCLLYIVDVGQVCETAPAEPIIMSTRKSFLTDCPMLFACVLFDRLRRYVVCVVRNVLCFTLLVHLVGWCVGGWFVFAA